MAKASSLATVKGHSTRCAADFPKKSLSHRVFREVNVLNTLPSSANPCCQVALSAADAKKRIKQARLSIRKLCARIAKASVAGHDRKARNLTSRLFKDRLCGVAAIHYANSRRPRRREAKLSDIRVVQAASTLSVWHPCAEPVLAFGQAKPNGGLRVLNAFGLYGRARQYLVSQALKALHAHKIAPFQYGVLCGRERSRDACVLALSENIDRSKATHFAEIDIVNFFGSVNPLALEKEIGLPSKVIKYVICADAYCYHICKGHNRTLLEACRKGIPQGSPASSIVAAVVIGKVTDGRDHRSFVNYVDNFGLFGNSRIEVAAQTQTLCAAISGSRYGTFELSKPQDRSIDDDEGFNFLGYHCNRDWLGQIGLAPGDKSFRKVVYSLVHSVKDLRHADKKARAIRNPIIRGIKVRKTSALLKPSEIKKRLEAKINDWLCGFRLSTSSKEVWALNGLADYLKKATIDKVPISTICDRSDKRLARARKRVSDKSEYSILLAGR